MKLTEYLAIYAAALSTIVFLWNVSRALPRIKVDVLFGCLEIIDDHIPGIYIVVRNPSSQTIHLANVELLYPSETVSLFRRLRWMLRYRRLPTSVGWVHTNLSLFKVNTNCPVALDPGSSHRVFVPEKVLNSIFEKSCRKSIKASVQDQLWRDQYSAEFLYKGEGA